MSDVNAGVVTYSFSTFGTNYGGTFSFDEAASIATDPTTGLATLQALSFNVNGVPVAAPQIIYSNGSIFQSIQVVGGFALPSIEYQLILINRGLSPLTDNIIDDLSDLQLDEFNGIRSNPGVPSPQGNWVQTPSGTNVLNALIRVGTVPEPSSFALLGVGLLALVGAKRK